MQKLYRDFLKVDFSRTFGQKEKWKSPIKIASYLAERLKEVNVVYFLKSH